MAGHNKWSKVKRIKGAIDAKRGNLFSRLSKEIAVAARQGGGDPAGNARLRSAISAARDASMPNENIERAIRRGTGEDAAAAALEEITYEGYAPGGVAVLVECATDNKNRTAADMRNLFSKHHGNLGASGSVAYQFKRKGQITVPLERAGEDRVLELALEGGADDVTADDAHHIVLTPPDRLYAVGEALRAGGAEPDSMKLTYIPETTAKIEDDHLAAQVLRLCDAIEDHDDVLHVYPAVEIPDEVMARIAG